MKTVIIDNALDVRVSPIFLDYIVELIDKF